MGPEVGGGIEVLLYREGRAALVSFSFSRRSGDDLRKVPGHDRAIYEEEFKHPHIIGDPGSRSQDAPGHDRRR